MEEVVSDRSSVVSRAFSGDPQGSVEEFRIAEWKKLSVVGLQLSVERLAATRRGAWRNSELWSATGGSLLRFEIADWTIRAGSASDRSCAPAGHPKIAQRFIAGCGASAMSPSPAGTTEVMSLDVLVVQPLSRPYGTPFCPRPRNPAMNRWAILIRSLRDRMRMDSRPRRSRFHCNANTGERTRPCHTTVCPAAAGPRHLVFFDGAAGYNLRE